eukprot:TRINITY_DN12822_c0_g1_i2.p1 TRINITY_DN12822_c0_g1~~TRINITY_DN12822_c0_g1_i2.p1  ORF type:complete len:345 (+),score=36.35 TRINITY_DN12822_c0_g1_i2:41-1036(+)
MPNETSCLVSLPIGDQTDSRRRSRSRFSDKVYAEESWQKLLMGAVEALIDCDSFSDDSPTNHVSVKALIDCDSFSDDSPTNHVSVPASQMQDPISPAELHNRRIELWKESLLRVDFPPQGMAKESAICQSSVTKSAHHVSRSLEALPSIPEARALEDETEEDESLEKLSEATEESNGDRSFTKAPIDAPISSGVHGKASDINDLPIWNDHLRMRRSLTNEASVHVPPRCPVYVTLAESSPKIMERAIDSDTHGIVDEKTLGSCVEESCQHDTIKSGFAEMMLAKDEVAQGGQVEQVVPAPTFYLSSLRWNFLARLCCRRAAPYPRREGSRQ